MPRCRPFPKSRELEFLKNLAARDQTASATDAMSLDTSDLTSAVPAVDPTPNTRDGYTTASLSWSASVALRTSGSVLHAASQEETGHTASATDAAVGDTMTSAEGKSSQSRTGAIVQVTTGGSKMAEDKARLEREIERLKQESSDVSVESAKVDKSIRKLEKQLEKLEIRKSKLKGEKMQLKEEIELRKDILCNLREA